ncbi:PorT family protein [Microvirga sp. STR05]|uniref:PorT family protein n=1 Tax=Hymenobacter duratus TaxID=2771356 RepID=A0ABR8JC00_9BACT|nr:porin family protein [Hymenobacter duratus]MBD2714277.1 PorT family protein [Hymenobacter duratus]MBR7949180.1 PorT family protein [Microvirga sp. STR05]
MKKVFLTLALAAGMTSLSHAQGVKVGLKGGINLATLSGDDAEGFASKVCPLAGVALNLGINDMFSVQPEVLYSVKGTQSDEDSKAKLNLNYIDVPVLLKVNAGGLFFELGPQLGILASAKSKYEDESDDVKDTFKTVDFGYAAGLGYQLDGGLNLGLRYNGGIANVVDIEDLEDEPKVRNSAFQFYVGYMFGGK